MFTLPSKVSRLEVVEWLPVLSASGTNAAAAMIMIRARVFPHTHGQIERGVSAFRALSQAVRVAESRRSRRLGNGLTPAQLSIIRHLALRPGQSVNDLAAATHTPQTTVSVILRNLHDAGF